MSDKENIGQRLEWIIADKRLKSKRAFALSIGADPSFFDKMVRGAATLTDKYADNIASKYGVNKEWLYSGKGAPYLGNDAREPSTMIILDRLSQAFVEQAAAFRAQAEMMKSIESKMAQEKTQAKILKAIEDQEAIFARSNENQLGLASLVGEILTRDIAREAKNNPDNVQKILQDFLRRIGPKLTQDVKESIGADGHT
ncbi:MAG TPA: hypothetical protein VL832_11410 [Puia sp.]|nr:hypothetical protein [Puia sp.]